MRSKVVKIQCPTPTRCRTQVRRVLLYRCVHTASPQRPPPHPTAAPTHPPCTHDTDRQTDRHTHTPDTNHHTPEHKSPTRGARAPEHHYQTTPTRDLKTPPPGRGPRPYTQAPSTCHPALHSRRRSTLYLASAASCSLACLACAGKEAVGVTTTVRPHTLCDLTRVRVRANAEPLAPPHAGTGVGQGWRRPDLPPRGAPRGGVPRAPTTTTCQGG